MPDEREVVWFFDGKTKSVSRRTAAKLNRQIAKEAVDKAMRHEIGYMSLLQFLRPCCNDWRCIVAEALTGKLGAYSYKTCETCPLYMDFSNATHLPGFVYPRCLFKSPSIALASMEFDEAKMELAIIKLHAGLEVTGIGEKKSKKR